MAALLPKGMEVYILDELSALQTIGEMRKPDVVIVDFDAPAYGGLAGIEKLRELDWLRTARLVLYSYESGLDFVRTTMSLGVVGYLPKPISTQEIWDKLESIISNTAGGGQRREFVRVKPAPMETSRVELFIGMDGAGVGGELLDISLGGVAYKLHNPQRISEISMGQAYPRLELSLKDEPTVQVGVLAVIARGGTAAFKFTALTEEAMRTLCRYIHSRLMDASAEEESQDSQERLMKLV
jgi:CheY-like chemotaxis protein